MTPPGWLTFEALEELALDAEAFPDGSIERGRSYAGTGRVILVRWGDAEVSARVLGTQPYRTSWRWSGESWRPFCSCPVAPECKHAFALACVILAEGLSAEDLEEAGLSELLPARLVRRARTRGAEAGTGSRPSPEPRLRLLPEVEPQPRRQPVRPQPTCDQAVLERLRASDSQQVRFAALADLLREDPRLGPAIRFSPFPELVSLADPDLRCLLIARALAHVAQGRLPPELAAFLERPDLDERLRALAEMSLAARIAEWVAPRAQAARTLRLVLGLATEGTGDLAVTVEALLTSRRLKDERRDEFQLRQLEGEASREPGLLEPDQHDLLRLLLEPTCSPDLHAPDNVFRLSTRALVRLLPGAAGSPHVSWRADLPARLAERGGIQPGGPVRLGAGAVDVGPALAGGADGPRVVLGYRLPDDRLLGPDERLVLRATGRRPGGPTLVLAHGSFWTTRGEPPAPLPQMFEASGGLSLAEPRARALVAPLARRFPGFRASLGASVRVLAVHPLVSLDLHEDDWLHVCAFAPTAPGWRPGAPAPAGVPLFEWTTDGGWVATDGSPGAAGPAADGLGAETLQPLGVAPAEAPVEPAAQPAAPSDAGEPPAITTAPPPAALLELPDPDRIEPLAAWLAALGLAASPATRSPAAGSTHAPAAPGGWLRLTARTVEAFVAAFERRPPGVAWYGNAAARRLLDPEARLVPRLRVEPSGVDWLKVSAEWESEGLALTEADLAKLRGSGSRFVRLASGWASREQAQAQDGAANLLAELGLEPGVADQQVSVWQLAHARPGALDALDAVAGTAEALTALRLLRERIAAFRGVERVPVPLAIRAELRPYQREGLDFLACAASLGLGAVLADDMGLGKTLQALAFMARLVEHDPRGGPSLVVCPASVLHNWEREAARFAPGLRVLVLAAGDARRELRRRIPEHDLVVTNYALLRRDVQELGEVAWRAVILDEAQNVKNPDAQVSRAARALRARHRLALTGTPLENRALDLWSLMAFVNPGYLGTRAAFERQHDRADAPPHARRLLAARLRPVMLRRLKGQVAPELPARIEERRDCELSAGQRKLYLAELARGRELLARLAQEGGLQRGRISILAVLTRLRQICCHPALAGGRTALGSGKFEALFELLEPLLAEGHKVLVFSQFVECLRLLEQELRARRIAFHVLTGASRKRGEIVAAFEGDPEPAVFLISLKAGGTGLNLTAASYVVLFDPWWNPAVEAQAIDRTHRIGQDRTVIAYRLVARGTIEERIRELQERKAALVRDIVGEEGFAKAVTREDLDFLFAEA